VVQLLVDWAQGHRSVLYALLALAFGIVIGRYRAYHAVPRSSFASLTHRGRPLFQTGGEALVSRVVKAHFGAPYYHLMNHVTLQLKDGTTEVDHILVSQFGVFVIETKNYKGWIFADATQPNWTQVLFRRRFRFQNPILQNFRHVRAVQDLLDFLSPDAVKSVVVFTGAAEFKTAIPRGVFDLSDLIEYLRNQTVPVMSLNRRQFRVGRLETARLALSGKTDVEHIQSLQQRHGRFT
jgi:hypothetical protein